MRRALFVLLVLLALGAAGVWAGELGIGPILITHEGEQKIVTLFGNPRAVYQEPGLALRIPLITQVRSFDSRHLYLNAEPREIRTRDAEPLVVDNYAIWRIVDPLRFYASFPDGMKKAKPQIDRVVRADVRSVIGQHTLAEVLTERRVEIMERIARESGEALDEYGIEVTDVRINRTELPPATLENVYARMRSERERLARKYRAEGAEEGRRIRAEADRAVTVIVAEARRDAEIVRGEGDAEATRIYAEAYSQDTDFYAFVRNLEAYRKTIGEYTTLILPPSHEFFRALQAPTTENATRPPAAPGAP